MPLQGYLKTSEPSRISSISTGTREKRKQIIAPSSGGEQVYVIMRVTDCLDHSSPHPTVPVELMERHEGGRWDSKGVARCCPLCWKILEFPQGFNPEIIPQVLSKKKRLLSPDQRAALRRGRKSRHSPRKGFSKQTEDKLEQIRNMTEVEVITVYDAMERLEVSRTLARKLLEYLVTVGDLKAIREGAGRGHQTSYEKTP